MTGSGWLDRVIVAPPPSIWRFKVTDERWRERADEPRLKNVVLVDRRFDASDLLPVGPGTLDAVVFHLAYHDMVWMKVDRDRSTAACSPR